MSYWPFPDRNGKWAAYGQGCMRFRCGHRRGAARGAQDRGYVCVIVLATSLLLYPVILH